MPGKITSIVLTRQYVLTIKKNHCVNSACFCFCCVLAIYGWQPGNQEKKNLIKRFNVAVLPSAGFMTASWRTVAKLPATPETQDTSNSDTIVVQFAD